MGSPSKGRFVLVAVGAALVLALVAKFVADRFMGESLDWVRSLVTAAVVGSFVALIVFRPRGTQRRTEFTVEASKPVSRAEEE